MSVTDRVGQELVFREELEAKAPQRTNTDVLGGDTWEIKENLLERTQNSIFNCFKKEEKKSPFECKHQG